MADTPDLAIPPNQAVIAAGVEPDGTRSGIALDATGRIILSASSATPSGSATYAAQTDGSQRAGVLGRDGTTIAADLNPFPTITSLAAAGPSNPPRKLVPTGAAEPIVATSYPATQWVRYTPDPLNTKAIYIAGIGQASVANSMALFANDIVTLNVANANLLECISGDAGQYVRIEVL